MKKTLKICKPLFADSLNSIIHLPVGFDFRLKQIAGIYDFKLLEFWQTGNLIETWKVDYLKCNDVLSTLPITSKLRLWKVLKLLQWRHKGICNFKGYSLSNICSIWKSRLDAEHLLLKEILLLLLVGDGKSRKWQQNSVSLMMRLVSSVQLINVEKNFPQRL